MRCIISAILVVLPISAYAEGFGVTERMPLTELPGLRIASNSGTVWAFDPPAPQPPFDRYEAFGLKEVGVCAVVGAADLNPEAIERAFLQVGADLEQQYGAPVPVHSRYLEYRPREGLVVSLSKGEGILILGYAFGDQTDCL